MFGLKQCEGCFVFRKKGLGEGCFVSGWCFVFGLKLYEGCFVFGLKLCGGCFVFGNNLGEGCFVFGWKL